MIVQGQVDIFKRLNYFDEKDSLIKKEELIMEI